MTYAYATTLLPFNDFLKLCNPQCPLFPMSVTVNLIERLALANNTSPKIYTPATHQLLLKHFQEASFMYAVKLFNVVQIDRRKQNNPRK